MAKIARQIIVLTLALHVLAARGTSAGETTTLLGQYTLSNPGAVTDIWGYVDPNTNREYALVGETNSSTGVSIIDVTDPTNPTLVGQAAGIVAADMKVWRNYLYVVTGFRGPNEARIFDLTDPRTPQYAGAFESSHTLFIDDRGSMYLSLAGEPREVRIYDVARNPTSPSLLWMDGIGEPHAAYVVGTTLYDFHGYSGTRIYDVTARAVPFLLGVVTNGEFHHSGMPTEDGKYLFITQELVSHPRPDITVWNIEDPANPVLVGEIADPNATAHNLYIIGRYAYVSYYSAGFRVYDVSNPAQPVLVAEYDTSAWEGDGFRGCWGVYPFPPSGHIYASDRDNGLFVFSFSGATTSAIPVPAFTLYQNVPNPFNPSTTLYYAIPSAGQVELSVYNAAGQRVRTLVNDSRPAGPHSEVWNGQDDRGNAVAAGVYFARLSALGSVDAKRMVLVK